MIDIGHGVSLPKMQRRSRSGRNERNLRLREKTRKEKILELCIILFHLLKRDKIPRQLQVRCVLTASYILAGAKGERKVGQERNRKTEEWPGLNLKASSEKV